MKIQSLSVVVPVGKCINKCKFCVACMIEEDYENMITGRNLYYDLYEKDYIKRLEFARDNGCNTIMLTGNGEPQQNWEFLKFFGSTNNRLEKPFRIVEMQTTGVLIDNDYLYFLRHHVGVTTISLSISSLDDLQNLEYNGTPGHIGLNIQELCKAIKKYRFNLRLSLNMTDYYNDKSAEEIFDYCKNHLGADQITFRVLYDSGTSTAQDKWIRDHKASDEFIKDVQFFIKEHGTPLEQLEFGATKYDVMEMSTVLDDDCMSQELKDAMKYLILRENAKLYSHWNTKGSLIF